MLTPGSEAELAEAVAGAEGPLSVVGGGTRGVMGPGDRLSVAGLSGISLYEPGALTLVAGAGTALADVEAALDAEGQRLAFEPMDHRALLGLGGTPTIGGVVAGNVSGPRRIQVGACRDAMLGLRFVDGAGTVVKNGGRVMKNVTGYDLVKLLTGSFGTLGVISEVSMKVLPRPETEGSLILQDLPLARGVEAMSAALSSPFEVTGAAYLPATAPDTPAVMLRLEGFEDQVRYRLGALQKLLGGFGDASRVEGEASARAWALVRDAEPLAQGEGDIWRISAKPSDAPGLVRRIEGTVMLDWGGGLIWARVAEGLDLRGRLGRFEGHATLVRGSAATRAKIARFHPPSAPIAALSAGLKAKFDPRGVLNPGVMV